MGNVGGLVWRQRQPRCPPFRHERPREYTRALHRPNRNASYPSITMPLGMRSTVALSLVLCLLATATTTPASAADVDDSIELIVKVDPELMPDLLKLLAFYQLNIQGKKDLSDQARRQLVIDFLANLDDPVVVKGAPNPMDAASDDVGEGRKLQQVVRSPARTFRRHVRRDFRRVVRPRLRHGAVRRPARRVRRTVRRAIG